MQEGAKKQESCAGWVVSWVELPTVRKGFVPLNLIQVLKTEKTAVLMKQKAGKGQTKSTQEGSAPRTPGYYVQLKAAAPRHRQEACALNMVHKGSALSTIAPPTHNIKVVFVGGTAGEIGSALNQVVTLLLDLAKVCATNTVQKENV